MPKTIGTTPAVNSKSQPDLHKPKPRAIESRSIGCKLKSSGTFQLNAKTSKSNKKHEKITVIDDQRLVCDGLPTTKKNVRDLLRRNQRGNTIGTKQVHVVVDHAALLKRVTMRRRARCLGNASFPPVLRSAWLYTHLPREMQKESQPARLLQSGVTACLPLVREAPTRRSLSVFTSDA